MKKFLTSLFVVLLVCISSVAMFACQSNVDKNKLFEQVDAIMTKIDSEKEEKGMFVSATDLGLSSDYALFYYSSEPTYNYYSRLFIIAMNYVKGNYELLENLDKVNSVSSQGQDAINAAGAATTEFEVNYDICVNDFKTYLNLSEHEKHPDVLGGALTVYRASLKSLIGSTFKLANAIADVKNYVFDAFEGLKITNVEIGAAETAELRDYAVLKLANKLYQTLIINLNMKDYTAQSSISQVNEFAALNSKIKTALANIIKLQATQTKDLLDLSGEQNASKEYENGKVSNILAAIELMDNEGKLLDKAQENFSLEKFFESYSCNLDAYTSDLQYADIYLKEITTYYQDHIQNYVNHLTNLLVTKE